MDFDLSPEQAAIADAVGRLLAERAGAERAAALAREGGYDDALERALDEAGFLDAALVSGPLEAALVVEAVARAGGAAAIGAAALAAPLALGRRVPGPVALARAEELAAPVRFLAHARTLLVCDGAHARALALAPGDAVPVRSGFGYPMGRLRDAATARGERMGEGTGPRLLAAWRVALALEASGAMAAALEVTVAHAKHRRQFGRAIGSFQAVQHRLAECAVRVEASRWLAYEAAARGAPGEAAATAAAYAADAARLLFAETHQLSGAMGFTREHPLHVFSLRLVALRLEAGGADAHAGDLARARWGRTP